MAFKVATDSVSKKPILQPAWVSGDFDLPDPVIIANGVVFALSTGENANQLKDRLTGTKPAVLYALDAKTGRELYNSGSAMTGWVHFSGLALADGNVYAEDHDSTIYCFGLRRK
jgi:outer membrane protein assembly factor BamB